ncbi:MAG TPA: GFA family protein [Nocardioides sp.]|uniref:GFA family protein n=1 Tax=uncultured Nocardioides sp. TaxID=198441 RepID=UPI000EDCF1DB|nr:GFA family protein [uncultured Nocardioides sp.]HCB06799.1 aldehyde-activating protein [Nocardioides sp.]HRD61531.1 GFA family protein [Nocardioides sp.]HRI95391.1 GFA family protein [Nocardioides sp.]HRK44783.1 GFA family protein [Nocardioides sp.]
MDEQTATGRCLCGAVSYAVSGPLRDVVDCHCHRCRRFTGHHLAATSAAATDLAIEDPQEQLTWFFPVDQAAYGFCRGCGSSLFWRGGSTPDRTSICAGTLDPPTGLRTVEAWWVSEASDYFERPDLPEHATE